MTESEIVGLGWSLNIIFAVLCGLISQGKDRGFGIGFLWGFLLGPIGLIIVALMKQGSDPNTAFANTGLRRQRGHQGGFHEERLTCGSCGANITRQMNFCPVCSVAIQWPADMPQQSYLPQRRNRMR